MKIVTIDSDQFDNFAKKHKYRNYYQTSKYGNIMNKFNYEVRCMVPYRLARRRAQTLYYGNCTG